MRYYADFDRVLFDAAAFALFNDAASFLRDKENASTIIVSSGERSVREPGVKRSLEGIPRMSVMYTGGVPASEYLAPHTHLHKDALLVDSDPEELALLAASCPLLALYEIRRDGAPGDGRWPVVRSLQEIP
jgi:hypothetical protein